MSRAVISYYKEFETETDREIQRKLDQAAQELADYVKLKLSEGRRGSIGTSVESHGEGAPPHVDTGQLRNSIFWESAGEKVRIIGTPMHYALTQEFGATITPKRGKYLTIPWSPQAKKFARSGGRANEFTAGGKKLRLFDRSKDTMFLIQDVRGKNARMIIHYILTTHAVIMPHPFLRPSLEEMWGRIQVIFFTEGR